MLCPPFFSPSSPLDLPPSSPPAPGIIREEGGKLHMRQCQWSDAYSEFNEGFRAYQVRCEGRRAGKRKSVQTDCAICQVNLAIIFRVHVPPFLLPFLSFPISGGRKQSSEAMSQVRGAVQHPGEQQHQPLCSHGGQSIPGDEGGGRKDGRG